MFNFRQDSLPLAREWNPYSPKSENRSGNHYGTPFDASYGQATATQNIEAVSISTALGHTVPKCVREVRKFAPKKKLPMFRH
jgi:hypothetical protein